MKTMKMMVLPMLMIAGCGDDTGTTTDMAKAPDLTAAPDLAMVPDMTMLGDMAMIPAMPQLGVQIDRMGRPTINVAATNPFDLDLSALHPGATSRDTTRDLYNQDTDQANWVKNWAGVLGKNLAIYDGADAMCGNQLLADPQKMDPTRYATFSAVLADDRLYVDTAQMMCNVYLAVEANGPPIMAGLKDCGGRTPLYNVVHETYTALTVGIGGVLQGIMTGTFPVTDGVAKDNDGVASLTTFPFLADPN